ncbi:hypothetical protein OHA74_53745 [Streptomyces phaeochromogenes]|uniref:hypothetical protein n=1 Tax=Streptomyces phaeochromogenes TaxID=1923 RepID=UPI002E2B2E4D|nr:hypothetical protein [Streptomyces phaeochromogenes]
MIIPTPGSVCLLCVPATVRNTLSESHKEQCIYGLFHHWHQSYGEAFAFAMAKAMGSIQAVTRELKNLDRPGACRECRGECIRRLAGILIEVFDTLCCCPIWPDRSALRHALAARNAVIEGNRAKVDSFSSCWLGLSKPDAWRAAVEMALLGEWVNALGGGEADTSALLGLLRQHIRIEHRRQQPLWERRIGGARTVLLGSRAGEMALGGWLATPGPGEGATLAAELLDPRIAAVLRQLQASEETTAHLWACSGDSWAWAAAEAGLPVLHGERVRRKLKRLGSQHTVRADAAAIWRAQHSKP